MRCSRPVTGLSTQTGFSPALPAVVARTPVRQLAGAWHRVPQWASSAALSIGSVLQRTCCSGGGGACDTCAERDEALRTPGHGAHASGAAPKGASVPPVVTEVLSTSGRPLDAGIQTTMEEHLGHDLAQVRVHIDAQAARSARAVGALAYTIGPHIVFAEGQFNPGSDSGRRLLTHELVHTVQQRTVPAGGGSGLRIGEADSPLEREADQVADLIADARTPLLGTPATVSPAPASVASVLQRAVSSTDCTADQVAALNRAVPIAEAMVATAVRVIGSPTSVGDARVNSLLRKYFGDDSTSTYLHALEGFVAIQRGLRAGVTYECEAPGSVMFDYFCGGASAYVRHPIVAINIHVCPGAFVSDDWLATTIVHENSHLWDWTDDEQYCTNGCSLDRWDAYDNADSYAQFAREAYHTF